MLLQKPKPSAQISATTAIGISAGMAAVMPLAIDVYLIVMPAIANDLSASLAATQRTMAAFAVGFGVAQLFVGAAADRYGRRPVAFAGTSAFLLASLGVVLAPTLEWLTASRFLQGLCVATLPILSRAIVRDVVPAEATARAYSLVNAIGGIAPVCAPFLGAAIAAVAGWRWALCVLIVYALGLLIALWITLPETRPAHSAGAASGSPFSAASEILRHRRFQIGAGIIMMLYSALFTWLTIAPFLMIDRFGFSSEVAAAVFGLGSAGYMVASLAAARLAHRFSPERMIGIGATSMLLGGLLGLLAVTRDGVSPIAVLAGMLPFYVGIGFALSNAVQVVMRPFSHIAGQASAWLGVLQQSAGAAVSLLAISLGGGINAFGVMIGCCLVLLTLAAILNRPPAGYRGGA